MTTFEEARAIVAAKYFAQAKNEEFLFEPWIAEWGYENKDFWMLIAGPKEWLVDGIESLAPTDDIVRLVSKVTGEFVQLNAPTMLVELDEFEPVGDIPQNFQ